MKAEEAVGRGGSTSVLAVSRFASCPVSRLTACDHPNLRITLFLPSKNMSGAGYDVVVDVDEEVRAL